MNENGRFLKLFLENRIRFFTKDVPKNEDEFLENYHAANADWWGIKKISIFTL